MSLWGISTTKFEAWNLLASRGCRSLDQLFPSLYGSPFPATCLDVTSPDNAILSPTLVPLVRSIAVQSSEWFATHRPVTFDLRVPSEGLFVQRPQFPRSLIEFEVPDNLLKDPDFVAHFQDVHSLQEWGESAEAAFDQALHKQGLDSLPRAFRGCCQPVAFKKHPITSPVKLACPSSFEPSTEVLTVHARRKVTQVRRLESLYRRLLKWEWSELQTIRIWSQLCQAWTKIHTSTAFGLDFLSWLLQFPDMEYPAWPMPSAAWIFEAYQMAKRYLAIALKEDERTQSLRASYLRMSDQGRGIISMLLRKSVDVVPRQSLKSPRHSPSLPLL